MIEVDYSSRKGGFALWFILREVWSLRLTRLYVVSSTKTPIEKRVDEYLMLILGLWNPQTPFKPLKFLSFIAMNHNLHYMVLKALFNQAKIWTDKWRSQNLKSFSIRVVTSWIKLLVIMHADKISAKKRNNLFW